MSDSPTAYELAEQGIKESHETAEDILPGWSERAIEKVSAFARFTPEFLTEDARVWAHEDGLDEQNESAWGHVMRTAAKRGIIHRWGERKAESPGSHGKLMAVWRRGEKPPGMATRQEGVVHLEALERHAAQMRSEGRAVIAEHLRETVRIFGSFINV